MAREHKGGITCVMLSAEQVRLDEREVCSLDYFSEYMLWRTQPRQTHWHAILKAGWVYWYNITARLSKSVAFFFQLALVLAEFENLLGVNAISVLPDILDISALKHDVPQGKTDRYVMRVKIPSKLKIHS